MNRADRRRRSREGRRAAPLPGPEAGPGPPRDVDIWGLLERSVKAKVATGGNEQAGAGQAGTRGGFSWWPTARRIIRVMDVFAPIAWTYALLTLFVVDIVGPAAEVWPVVDTAVRFRALVVLGLLIALFVILRRWAWAVLGYLIAYPVIVLAWKIPTFFWRRKSWALLLAGVQAIFAVLSDLRYRLIATWLTLFGAAVVLFVPSSSATLAAAAALVIILSVSLLRSAFRTVTTPSFVSLQQAVITRILSADRTRSLLALDDKYLRDDIERYEPDDAQQVMLRIGAGVALNKALLLWASQLEQYRKQYRPNLIFGAVSFVWVYALTLATLAVVNFGVLKWDPSQYVAGEDTSFIAVLLYTFSTMSGTGGGAIQAAGDVGILVALVGGIYGALVFAYLAVNVILVFRQGRDDEATQQLVQDLRQRAHQHAREFRSQYAVSVDEARRKLEAAGFGFATFLTRLSALIPDSEDGQRS